MQIAELRAIHARIPLKKTVRHASHVRTANDTLLVRCTLDDGAVGWGEGLPRQYVTGETIDSALDQFQRTDWSQLKRSLNGLDDALHMLQSLPLVDPAPAVRDCFGNSVRCAVELSVLDAVCRAAGVPLSEVTARVDEAAPLRERHDRVQYSAALTAAAPARDVLRLWMFRLYGFAHCKVKVGVDGQDDAATLRRARAILGRRADLRIDANEAWTCDELLSKIEPLRRYGISAIEQPVPHAEVDRLAEIRPRLGIPIMLDESLCSLGDARRAIERGTCDLFNIRLSKCGGFLNALRIAAAAHRAGLGYQLGCMVGETGILSAAGRHFATSVGGIRYLEGSFDRHLVREPLTREDLTFGRGGRAPALHGPGLSVDIDPDAVARVTQSTLDV